MSRAPHRAPGTTAAAVARAGTAGPTRRSRRIRSSSHSHGRYTRPPDTTVIEQDHSVTRRTVPSGHYFELSPGKGHIRLEQKRAALSGPVGRGRGGHRCGRGRRGPGSRRSPGPPGDDQDHHDAGGHAGAEIPHGGAGPPRTVAAGCPGSSENGGRCRPGGARGASTPPSPRPNPSVLTVPRRPDGPFRHMTRAGARKPRSNAAKTRLRATPAARAAMAQAVRADNTSQAEQILVETGSGRGSSD